MCAYMKERRGKEREDNQDHHFTGHSSFCSRVRISYWPGTRDSAKCASVNPRHVLLSWLTATPAGAQTGVCVLARHTFPQLSYLPETAVVSASKRASKYNQMELSHVFKSSMTGDVSCAQIYC